MSVTSGARVATAHGPGRVLNIVPAPAALSKAAGEQPEAPLARVRLDNGEVATVPVAALEAAAEAPAVAKSVTPENLDRTLAGLSQTERDALAIAWFTDTGPRLPRTIVGDEGEWAPFSGVDQATGALDQPAGN